MSPRVYWLRRGVVALAVIMVIGVVVLVVGAITSSGEVGRKVVVGGADVSGLSREEAEARLESRIDRLLSESVPVEVAGTRLDVPTDELGAEADVSSAVDAALEARNPWNPVERIASLFSTERLPLPAAELDPAHVEAVLGPRFAGEEIAAVDAQFVIEADGSVRVEPSKEGKGLDLDRAVEDLRTAVVATGSDRRVVVPLASIPPKRTTQAAEAMGIKEQVGTFTTKYTPGEPRVKNIQRIAELLDGTVIAPGATFSTNETAGPRTLEHGFVNAPVIDSGELVEGVGGGVSQIGTTLFNAAFFAGLPITEHTAHSFYISRYPLGREATLVYPGTDVKFVNDYASHLLLKVAAGPSSVTVSLYGTADGRVVETTTGERESPRKPKVVCRVDPTLKPGTEKVIQQSADGFSVAITRTVTYADGKADDVWKFTTVYKPKNRIITYNPAPVPPTTAPPTAPPAPTTAPAPAPAADAAPVAARIVAAGACPADNNKPIG